MVAERSPSAAAATDAAWREDTRCPTAPPVVAIRSSDKTYVHCSKLRRYQVVAPVVVALLALLLLVTSCCTRSKQPVSPCQQVGHPENWPPARPKSDLLRWVCMLRVCG